MAESKSHDLRVIVCDDDRLCRLCLTDLLQSHGFQTYEAQAGREAIELVHRIKVDFGFFDYGLPDLNGTETIDRIREQRIKFPFVLMSGEENISHHLVITAGAVAFLQKPLDIHRIRNILNHWFDLHH